MEFALIVFFALWAFTLTVFLWRREAHSMRNQRDKVIAANNRGSSALPPKRYGPLPSEIAVRQKIAEQLDSGEI